ncbi:GGDEF domain-containing protein [Saccharospirillum salsuginis]|uniref:diguanylate cyclase n=1 Tax=Saccharospirillum salsuginis TaxID=418750 RepID=A0A918NBU6_9GAMM|nr:sensor domain-containing diguanylate cyclase [Saccharospirillum salsuginis]GGX56993.1 GGDEF domain-containing protein [Saccharospirillum salsuginis]
MTDWFPWLTWRPDTTEQAFRDSFIRRMRTPTNWSIALATVVGLSFILYAMWTGDDWQSTSNIYRVSMIAVMVGFLLIGTRLGDPTWMMSLYATTLIVITLAGLMFLASARRYGALTEGGPMVVAMLCGILPVLHLGHKLMIWLLLAVFVGVITQQPGIETGWTLFYYAVTVSVLSVYQWQMDRLMRIQYLAESLEREKAETDHLTGTLNRYSFEARLSERLTTLEPGEGVALAMVDIDFFKQFNDHYGHLEGDRALVRIAKSLDQTPADLVVRFGGEEFVVLSFFTDRPPAWVSDLHETVSALGLVHEASPLGTLTISVGVACFVSQGKSDRATVKSLLTAADHQLYQVKANGRNQTRYVDL